MMTGSRLRYFYAAFSLAATALLLPVAAYAYTPEQQQACSNDAFRVCSSEIPDVDRVTACMLRNKAQLSPECRAQFNSEPVSETVVATAGKPMKIKPGKTRKSSAKPHKSKKPATTG